MNTHDVIIVGAGPAGMSIAAELCQRGLRTTILTPTTPPPWPNTYGMWGHELEALGLTETFAMGWSSPVVRCQNGGSYKSLQRTYALLDNTALYTHFLDRCDGAEMICGEAVRVITARDHVTLVTRDGRNLDALLVIDATGHNPALVRRQHPHNPGMQVAYGVIIDDPGPKVLPHDMVLMDFESPGPAYHNAPPTFLYAMRLGQGRVFLEETSLSSRPALTLQDVEQRLHVRMKRRGLDLTRTEIHEVERCLIPMGGALPELDQRVLGFGGAASMVHPATGYHLARTFSWAGDLANALAQAKPQGSQAMSRAGWRALWTNDRLRQRELYLYGLEMLLGFDTNQLQNFFGKFFVLPDTKWSTYLSGTSTSADLAKTMLSLFGQVDTRTRLRLMRPALGQARGHLLRALIPSRKTRS